jgi:hypothetical protein
VALAAREDTEHGALEPQLANMCQLHQRVLQVGHGDDTQAQQAVGGHRAIVLCQEIVVGADTGFVCLVVTDIAPEVWARGLPWKQHLSVDAVKVLFLQALLSWACARRGRVVLAVGPPDVASLIMRLSAHNSKT